MAVTILAASLLISACGNQPEKPKHSQAAPPATSNRSTKAPTPSAAPGQHYAPKPTRQGALDVTVEVEHAIDEAYQTFDVSHVQRISTKRCAMCTEIIREFPRRRDQGYTVTGGRISLCGKAHIVGGTPADRRILLIDPIRASRLITRDRHGRIFNAEDDLLGSGPALTGFTITEAVWISDTWKILSESFQEREPGDGLDSIYSCRR